MASQTREVTFIATAFFDGFRGEVVDVQTHETLMRTGKYVSKETAKSATASMWRAKLARAQAVECAA